jgi:hypothetical protein
MKPSPQHWIVTVLCAVFLSGCAGARSEVPFSCPGFGSPRLYALDSRAKDGILEGPSSAAWFYLKPGKKPLRGAVEVEVQNLTASPVRISLALATEADFSSPFKLVPKPSGRNLATVENAQGIIRLRMVIPSSGPGSAFSGFTVRLGEAGLSGQAASSEAVTSRVRITAASIEAEETGWQRSSSFFWAGFGIVGGRIDASPLYAGEPSRSPAVLPADSILTLYFDGSKDAAGTIELQGRTLFSAGDKAFVFRKTPASYKTTVPSLMFTETPLTVTAAEGGDTLSGMRVAFNKTLPVIDPGSRFSPISADPHLILEWPQASWRRNDREIFSWDRFPSILIFDTADYAVQDRFFKRLAFFVEKQGFKGKLATDGEIASLHAFNAHDYRADSLAEFFEAARANDFPLNAEETELRDILLAEGIIRKDGPSYEGGAGAVLSISRQSLPYLRYMFVAHEGFHGIYFIDPDFRAKVAEVYRSMDSQAIRFLETYFSVVDSLGYDTTDAYLMENEFMGYLMQQSVDKVAPYFTGTISERFVRYGGDLKLADYIKRTNAAEFVRAASELNDYVFGRWGIAGGRTGLYIPD